MELCPSTVKGDGLPAIEGMPPNRQVGTGCLSLEVCKQHCRGAGCLSVELCLPQLKGIACL